MNNQVRLHQVLALVKKEAIHLQAVKDRMFDGHSELTVELLVDKLSQPAGIDTLESYGAKFSRLQDTITDKLLPLFLKQSGEKLGTVIENLNKAERLGLIDDVGVWLASRLLRNKLVHEYIEDPAEIVAALNQSYVFIDSLLKTTNDFETYIKENLDVL